MSHSSLLNLSFCIAGPCSLESEEQIILILETLEELSIPWARMPLFKPRTSPESFQGLGESGLPIYKKMKSSFPSLKFVTEILSISHLQMLGSLPDMIQIGARNMQNFELLKGIGRAYPEHRPYVMLKRNFASTCFEWVEASKYLTNNGVPSEKIIFCERGLRVAAAPYQTVLDWNGALWVKENTNSIVIIDPSHGSQSPNLAAALARMTISSGLDGFMIECHPYPAMAKSDGHQALNLEQLRLLFASENEQPFLSEPFDSEHIAPL